ncbi:MAG: ribosome hibernation-promoting factor, HPF/YfiA family [Pseudobdellovibrionaceae bacterium]
MKMSFVFKHLDHSESLQEFAQNRLDETLQFLLKQGLGHCHFSKTKSVFHVEIVVNTQLKFFKSSAESEDVYAAVEKAVLKLEKQVMKSRQLNKSRKSQSGSKWDKLDQDLLSYRKAA